MVLKTPNPCRVNQTAPLRASELVAAYVPEVAPLAFVMTAPFASTQVPAVIQAPELTNTLLPPGCCPLRTSIPFPNTPLPGLPETAIKVPFVLMIRLPGIYNRPPVLPGCTTP